MERLENEVHEALAVMDRDTGKMMNYRQLIRNLKYKEVWSKSPANEFDILANGVGGRIKGTNSIKFISKRQVPKNRLRDETYGQFVCIVRPEKEEKERSRFVAGGDRVNYPWKVATPTSSNPNSRNVGSKDTFQQCSINARSKVHVYGYIQLLSHDTIKTARIHPYEDE